MITPADRRHLLHLLAGDELAWEMIATWPNVNLDGLTNDREAMMDELADRWSALCGRSSMEVGRAMPKLVDNGFVRMDGTVDPLADKYVEAMMVAKLPRGVRPEKKTVAHESKSGAP